MFEHDNDAVQRMVERLRAPVEMNPALDERVMARIVSAEGSSRWRLGNLWAWLRRPRPVPVSPLGLLVTAAALAGVAVWWHGTSPSGGMSQPEGASGPAPVQFVVVARGASSVALVGDFNDWDTGRTPMRLTSQGGIWSVVIPLTPGRHRYAFLVNGSRWLADPAAPRAPDDFGTPSSVVTVGG